MAVFGYFNKVNTYLKAKAENEKAAEVKRTYHGNIGPALDKNLALLRDILGVSQDVIIKEFNFGCDNSIKGALLCIDGLVDKELIDMGILKPIMFDTSFKLKIEKESLPDLNGIGSSFLSSSEVKKVSTFDDLMPHLLSGYSIMLVDGAKEAFSIGTQKWEKRSIEEPSTEKVIRGPRQGFTEALRTNTALLRRIIKNPNLQLEALKIGEQTDTDICLAYIKGIVKPELLDEIRYRLGQIKTDSILDSGYIEAFIEDAPFSIFSTVSNSERPDTVAARLMEGRAAIIVDGSPFVLTVPMVFIESFQTAEDYYARPFFATSLRLIRLISYFLAILAPALYVALTTFHQELIPTQLLFAMSAGVSGVPFPAMVEALLMVVMFDILKEAGVRLPKPVGSAVSIVGALVIGQSAVTAGLVGPFMVIIVAVTAIASFAVPAQMDSTALLRYFFLILGGSLGGFGIMAGMLIVLIHLIALRSFGVPYLSPIVPFSRTGMKDTFVRVPLWAMLIRPGAFAGYNKKRRATETPPDSNGPQE